ncbi:MAG: hypothetical protein F6K21_08745 [Symploca sp. SIO2D2]|nr:hypothetical protein [Symploca sp. SIO2D2]
MAKWETYVGSSLIAAITSIAFQLPAVAELVNVKLGNLGQSDWNAYCASKINKSNGKIVATLADTHVLCQVAISVTGYTQSEAESNAFLAGQNTGLEGGVSGSGRYGSLWVATFTSRQEPHHLKYWCREKYAGWNYYLDVNPFTGKNRIFVGDGGHACYKTVNMYSV